MTFTHGIGEETARPVMWLFEGVVEHKGNEHRFWYQYDERDADVEYEFEDGEPSESFDYQAFADYCQQQIESRWVPEVAS